MKIRLARKIWNRPLDKMSPYWINKFVKADKWNSRLTQALRKVVKWKSHNSKHRLEKSVRITPSQAKELRKIVEMMSKPLPDRIKFTKQRLKL